MSQQHLHALHRKEGAHFADSRSPESPGWELPEHYGSPVDEVRAVREGVGLADLSHEGKFIISGSDRIAFLQKLISNDLGRLSEGKGLYTTFLTAKGKMIADFHLFSFPDTLLMEIDWANAEKTKAQLMRFRLRSKVEFSTPPWGKILVSGPSGRALLEKFVGEALLVMQELSFFKKEVRDVSLTCIKRSVTAEEDFHLYMPLEDIPVFWKRLREEGHSLGAVPVGQAALETLRIEAGLPRYGRELDEEILPIEAGLGDEVISYTKGCYPGQEVIARIKTYGHVNKVLSGLILEGNGTPRKGDAVFQGEKEVGYITSAARSPHLGKIIAMAYLRSKTDRSALVKVIRREDGQDLISAKVTDLPFYTRK